MAFNIANLALIQTVNGWNLWSYKTGDADTVVRAAGYFTGDAVKMLRIGDLIIRKTGTLSGGVLTAISTIGFHVVNANDGTTVDLADTTAVSVTDSD